MYNCNVASVLVTSHFRHHLPLGLFHDNLVISWKVWFGFRWIRLKVEVFHKHRRRSERLVFTGTGSVLSLSKAKEIWRTLHKELFKYSSTQRMYAL